MSPPVGCRVVDRDPGSRAPVELRKWYAATVLHATATAEPPVRRSRGRARPGGSEIQPVADLDHEDVGHRGREPGVAVEEAPGIAAEVEGLVAGFDRERSGPALAPDEVERRAGRVLPPQDRVSAHLLEVEVRVPERELGRAVAVDIGAVASGGG